MVDRIAPGCDGFYGKYWKRFDLVVIASMVTKWAFFGLIVRNNIPLKNDLTVGRDHQIIVSAML